MGGSDAGLHRGKLCIHTRAGQKANGYHPTENRGSVQPDPDTSRTDFRDRCATDEILKQHQWLLSWADIYADAAPEEKRMIAAYIVKAVTLSKGYDIQVELNISEAQYLNL